MFQVIVVFLHKGAITKVILECDLNAMDIICMEMASLLANFTRGCQIL